VEEGVVVGVFVAVGNAVADGTSAPAVGSTTSVAVGLAVALDVPGGVALAEDVGILVAIDVVVMVGVGGWVLPRTTIVPVTLLTLFMW